MHNLMLRKESPFGVELKHWRARRGLSQMALANLAATTPRYVSFIETGRSRPSRVVIERLADVLDIPLRERNRLLGAAGIAPAYPESSFQDVALAPFRNIVGLMLEKQEPYPAYALDRNFQFLQANKAGKRLLPGLGESDWIDLTFAQQSPIRASLENFAELAWATVDLMRRELDGTTGPLRDVLTRLEGHLVGIARPTNGVDSRVVCPRFRFGDQVVRTIVTVARFGSARDVFLDELRVELVFPADESSARFFAEMAALDP